MVAAVIDTGRAQAAGIGLRQLAASPGSLATEVSGIAASGDFTAEAAAAVALLRDLEERLTLLGGVYELRASLASGADVFGADGIPGGSVILDFLLGDAANFWNGGRDGGLPVGQLGAGLLKIWRIQKYLRVVEEPLPVFSNGLIGKLLSKGTGRIPRLAPAGAWLQSPAGTQVFKRVGVAGGVVSTAMGAYDLYQQGNPVDAYQREGAGYVADVASTAFSASSTAFLLAPNPVTGAVAIGTGLVWAGAEVWDHREEIADWTSDRADDLGRAWDRGSELATQAGATVSEAGEELLDRGGEVVSSVASAADPRNWF